MPDPPVLLPAALNQGWIYRDRIGPSEQGLSALAFYASRYAHSDPTTWERRLAAGEVLRSGLPLRADQPLAAGDQLVWHRPPWWEEAVPAPGPALYDDGDLCVLDKPSGLPVLPAGGWLEHTLLRLMERRHQGEPSGIPKPVHRLGRFTSGLLLCARKPSTRAWLSAALRESTAAGSNAAARDRSLRKIYRAWLQPGSLPLTPGESLELRMPIGRCPHPLLGRIWCVARADDPEALPASSSLTLLQRSPAADLVSVAIGSGRPHQIRIHCAAAGAPLLGDPLYRVGGLADPEALPGQGGYRLQAWRLELQRPEGSWLQLAVPEALELPA